MPGITQRSRRRASGARRLARLLTLAAALSAVGPLGRGEAGVPPAVTWQPPGHKVRLRVGQRQEFSANAAGERILCFWQLNRRAIPGSLPVWLFVPTVTQVGTHHLTVAVHGPHGMAEHGWTVRVDPPRPPHVVAAAPAATSLEAAEDEPVELTMEARAATAGETVQTSWTVDGAPAGEGERLRLDTRRAGTIRARALATGSYGAAVAREWQITVSPTMVAAATPTTVPAPPPAVTTTTTPSARPRASTTTTPVAVARATASTTLAPSVPAVPPGGAHISTPATEPPPTARVAAPPATLPVPVPAATPTTTVPTSIASRAPESAPAPPPPHAEVTRQDVEDLLLRYAAAWRRHDVEELRHIGQVTTEGQAAALRDYFARTESLEVSVELLEVTAEDGHRTVRFTRRDSFRDPLGRVVSKETPPIEKGVVRADGEVRFVVPGR